MTSEPRDDAPTLFRREYRRELERWLRTRFRALCVIYIVIAALDLAIVLLFQLGSEPALVVAARITGHLIGIAIVAWHLLSRDWSDATRPETLRGATRMILMLGAVTLLISVTVRLTAADLAPIMILRIFFWHFSACLLLPWTPRESARPFVPLLVAWAAIVMLLPGGAAFDDRLILIIFGPAVLLPGLGVAAFRLQWHSRRFSERMVGSQFLTMRRELSRARSIHESMFPAAYDDGFVRFLYTYTPTRELGGDYIHLHVGATGLIHITLLDVTGHGLAAALTVNRVYGELERIRAEAPDAPPGEVLRLLNRYFVLTLRRHNIYATAACVTLDPYGGTLAWASAGHPPGFARGANGVIRDLAATTVLLGALDGDVFEAHEDAITLEPGDTLVLFTDGVFETRDRRGAPFGLSQVRDLMSLKPAPANWPRFLASAVDRHNGGHNDDDILIASIEFVGPRGAGAADAAPARAEAVPS